MAMSNTIHTISGGTILSQVIKEYDPVNSHILGNCLPDLQVTVVKVKC